MTQLITTFNNKLTTNNESLKPFLRLLQQIIDKETRSKYVTLISYRSNFGNPAYEFQFWGADTLAQAIRKESLETSISETAEGVIKWEGKDKAEAILKNMYNEEAHYIIDEVLTTLLVA